MYVCMFVFSSLGTLIGKENTRARAHACTRTHTHTHTHTLARDLLTEKCRAVTHIHNVLCMEKRTVRKLNHHATNGELLDLISRKDASTDLGIHYTQFSTPWAILTTLVCLINHCTINNLVHTKKWMHAQN